MGHIASKQELVAIIRRLDTDGDAKVSWREFKEGMRSSNFPVMRKELNRSSSKSALKGRQT